MRRRYADIQVRRAAVVAVSFEPRVRLAQLSRQMRLPFPLLSDPQRDAYRAYGLQRGAMSRIFGLGTIWAYVKLLARGRRYHLRPSDLRQLDGDFVIDTAGIVRYEDRGAAPHDRPPIERLLETLDRI